MLAFCVPTEFITTNLWEEHPRLKRKKLLVRLQSMDIHEVDTYCIIDLSCLEVKTNEKYSCVHIVFKTLLLLYFRLLSPAYLHWKTEKKTWLMHCGHPFGKLGAHITMALWNGQKSSESQQMCWTACRALSRFTECRLEQFGMKSTIHRVW